MSNRVVESQITPSTVPPLKAGDQLTRDEFERRYDATPGIKKAELIEGIVNMSPPVRWDFHGGPHMDLVLWLGTYRIGTAGVQGADNSSVRLDLNNEPQPDALLFIDPSLGGAAQVEEGIITGAPEFVAEVSASTASFDMNTKFRVFQRNGIGEYLVWRVRDRQVDWFGLRGDNHMPLPVDSAGVIRSKIFPGLWLASKALVDFDAVRVMDVLKSGMAAPEHAALVAELQSRRVRS
jgi:putative restriction endonuclease